MALTPSQVNDYYTTQNSSANPLSPAQYEASLNKPPPAPVAPPITPPGANTTTAPTVTPPPPAPTTTTSTAPTFGAQPERAALDTAQQEYQVQAKKFQDTVDGFRLGTIALTPAEEAQIAGLKRQFDGLISEQQLINKGSIGGGIMRGFSGGNTLGTNPLFYANTINTIASAGLAKVSDLQIKEASAIAALSQGFREDNIRLVKDSWDIYKDASEKRQQALKDTIKETQAVIKEQQDAKLKVQEGVDEVSADVLKYTGNAKLATLVGQSSSVSEALSRAGSSLQTSSNPDIQSWIFAKQKAEETGTVAPDYEMFQAKLEKQKLNSEIAKLQATEGIKFNYAVALERAKAAISNAPNPNYNGEFASTIKLAAQAGGTNAQRNQISSDLQDFIAQGDYQSAYTQILSSASAKLTGANASNFQQQVQSYTALEDMRDALKEYQIAGGNTNIFKGGADAIQTKIGALATDPKYAALAVRLNSAFQQYRQNMTGAAFGAKESSEYASVLPSAGNSFALNMAKLDGAESYLNSVVESTIKNTVGEGGIYIKQYAEAAQETQNQQKNTQDKMTQFRAASPQNEALVQELHAQFPNLTLDQISEELGL